MTSSERIRERRILIGLSQAQLAADLGVDQSTVAKWETGPNSPRPRALSRLADRLGVTVAWLLEGEQGAAGQRPAGAELHRYGPFAKGPRDLPVLGVAVGGDDAFFELNGEVHEYVERPTQLEEVRNAYALYVVGSSMEPRYFEGEIVYVNPNRPVSRGCFVVVELQSADQGGATGMLKQFLGRSASKITLRQFNPTKTLKFPLARVRHCHRIVQSGEP